ncbi:MAG TPA: YraN family protein [Usitatibacter sp.]|nr:YraN family protein [Usitatibacter sp.]
MTSPSQVVGADAEEIAARFLASHGLAIVERNFRTRFGEIDLIARDGASLVFVEVRMRTHAGYGGAAESVDSSKRGRIVAASRAYLASLRPEPPCRFDVVTLDGESAKWIRAAFEVAG